MNDQTTENLIEPDGLAQLADAKRNTRTLAPVAADDSHLIANPHPQLASPIQFRLRTLLVTVAALCGLFSIMHIIGAVWSSILLWFLFLVLAHVTANYWGTRVAPGIRHQKIGHAEPDVTGIKRPLTSITGAVRLSESLRPGWPMLIATTIGALIGGVLGSFSLVLLSLDRAGYTGVIVGTVSASIVGGFLGFLTSSFAEIALRAWREAVSGVSDRIE